MRFVDVGCDNCGEKHVPYKVIKNMRTYHYCSVKCRSVKWVGSQDWPKRHVVEVL